MNNLKVVKVKFLYFVFLTSLCLLNEAVAAEKASELSAKELKTVGQMIRASEDTLINIRIDSDSYVEQGLSSSGPWEKTPVCFPSTAYFKNISSDQMRIDFHGNVARWENGAAPYIEQSYSVSFDGVMGMRKNISTFHSGKCFDRHSGRISQEKPVELGSSWYDKTTGVYASLFFHYRGAPKPFPKRFSTHFEAAADPNYYLSLLVSSDPNYLGIKPTVKFKVIHQKLGEVECLKAAYIGVDGSFREEWWLDPNRGYALLKYASVGIDPNGNEQIKSLIDVTNLKKVAENVWWPMEAYFVERPREVGKPWNRIVYQASNIVANDPKFDETVFNLEFPKGYRIHDEIAGKTYIVDANSITN